MFKIQTKTINLNTKVFIGKDYGRTVNEFGKKVPFIEVVPIEFKDRKHSFSIHPYPHADDMLENAKKNNSEGWACCNIEHTNFASPLISWMFKGNRRITGKVKVGEKEYKVLVEETPSGYVFLSRADLVI